MKVLGTVQAKLFEPSTDLIWPEGWPIPPVGAEVAIGEEVMVVKRVQWHPLGDSENVEEAKAGVDDPFVWIVVGPEIR